MLHYLHRCSIDAAGKPVSLVAQTQVGRSWQWRQAAEVPLSGGRRLPG
jgi:hypothetical protein